MNWIDKSVKQSDLVWLGQDNKIGPFTTIGYPGENYNKEPTLMSKELKPVRIGNRNIIRENITIQDGSVIGNDNYIMSHSHVGHDVVIDNHVTVSTAVILGGHSHLYDHANMGLNSTTHQFVTIGAYAMIGLGSAVIEDVPPFAKVAGNPARIIGWNEVGMQRAGFTTEEITNAIKGNTKWHELFNQTHTRKIMKKKGE